MNNRDELIRNHKKWYTDYHKNFEALRDEMKERYLTNAELTNVQIEITRRCNYNCVMCANSEFTLEDKREDISFETLKCIIDSLPATVKSVNLTSYGEATLHKDYKDIVKYIHNNGLNVSVFTNSIFLDLSVLPYLSVLTFSLDAVQEDIFEKVRGIRNAGKTIENISKAIHDRDTKNLSVKISVNMVVSHENWREAEAVFAVCDELHVDELFLTAANNNFYHINREKFEQFEKELDTNISEVNWDDFVSAYASKEYDFPLYIWYPKRDMIGFCRFPFTEMMIDKNGYIHACCRTTPMEIGNVAEVSIADAFHSEIMNHVRAAHMNYTPHHVCSICSDGYSIGSTEKQ